MSKDHIKKVSLSTNQNCIETNKHKHKHKYVTLHNIS